MKALALGFVLFGAVVTTAQNSCPTGHFNVRNFDGIEYGGSPQNWDVVQDKDNLLYFANNSAVLVFNGESWNRFLMPNSRQPRSLKTSRDGTVYIGGVGCFGTLSYDEFGRAYCEEIVVQDSTLEFEDIWKIHEVGSKIAFVSFGYIFMYDPITTAIEAIPAPKDSDIKESAASGENLFVTIEKSDTRLLGVVEKKAVRIISRENVYPVKILPLIGRTILIDWSGALYNLDEHAGNFKLEKRTEKLGTETGDGKIIDIAVSEEMIAVAVLGKGVYLYNTELRLIRILQETDGLENLDIRKVYFDQYRNLWLCNDNGISFVETSSAITSFDKRTGITGITEDIYIDNGKVNLATHSDVVQADFPSGDKSFKKLGIYGMEVYQIRKFIFSDSAVHTLAILNEGIAEITPQYTKKPAIDQVYAWEMYQSSSDPDHLFIGLDGDGLGSARYKNGSFVFEGSYTGTAGQVRSIAELNGQVYYSSAFEGIFKLDTTKSQEANLLPGLRTIKDKPYTQFDMCVFDGRLFVGTAHGLYTLEGNTLMEFSEFGDTLCEANLGIHRLMPTEDGKLWMIMFRDVKKGTAVAEVGYLYKDGNTYNWEAAPFRPLCDDVIYSVTQQGSRYFWFGAGSSVFVYNAGFKTHHDISYNAFLTQIEVEPDSIYLLRPDHAAVKTHQFDYIHNSVTFQFSSTAYLGGITNEYSYFLEGEDTVWSKWSSENEAVYQRLGAGTYTFRVKARNYYGYESEEAVFTFTILPPWYQTIWAILGYILLAILLIYVIIRISIRQVKRQNERLEQIVEERTAEIAQQNQQLELQKTEIEEKSNDILDSIKYAKRIQNTILPDEVKLQKAFDFDHFVLYRPKDIVSGDFYWANRFEDKTIFSAIDCTGHGVPGAFVSIVGHNCLNRAVNEFKLRKPSEILDKLADLVIANFSQTHSQIKDGMDIALCTLDNKTLKIEYAGANNPLIIIRDGEMIEVKANKQPIGEFSGRVPFTNHEFQLKKGDCVYVFSDGYADQFGGEKGKKLKLKNLKTSLEQNYQMDMKSQHQELISRLEHWMTGFEQLDDICIFGVKI